MTEPLWPEAHASLEAFWQAYPIAKTSQEAIARVVKAASAADRLAYAFASAYQGALRVLAPSAPAGTLGLCITEPTGNHPRQIQCRLSQAEGGYRIDGKKSFATLGDAADNLLVLCVLEGSVKDERKQFRLVRVPKGASGLIFEASRPAPMVPEVAHSALAFEHCLVAEEQVFPGDGYVRYSKPFRQLEDAFVGMASAYHFRRLATAANHRELATEWHGVGWGYQQYLQVLSNDQDDLLALAALQRWQGNLMERFLPLVEFFPEPFKQRTQRDSALFRIAAKAHERRWEKAWQAHRAAAGRVEA